MRRIAILILTALSLVGCRTKEFYSHFEAVPLNNWEADSVLIYQWSVEDTAADYRILIEVRHTERYPYQNLWFFINKPHCVLKDRCVEGLLTLKDTIEFYLADERGQWLGQEYNGYFEMPVLYEEKYKFKEVGTYTMSIQHGMRTEQLRGISDVGVIISKNEELNHGKE